MKEMNQIQAEGEHMSLLVFLAGSQVTDEDKPPHPRCYSTPSGNWETEDIILYRNKHKLA